MITTEHVSINLTEFIMEMGETKTNALISTFQCPLNKDVENFLYFKSIEFSKQGIAATHLILTLHKDIPVLTGYYTLVNKTLFLHKDKLNLNNRWRKRLSRFSVHDKYSDNLTISMPLIAQLGKNDAYKHLITGDQLLKLACDKIKYIQLNLGGTLTYLECEDKEKLKEFYINNGFQPFGKRILHHDDKELMDGNYLIQMIKAIKRT